VRAAGARGDPNVVDPAAVGQDQIDLLIRVGRPEVKGEGVRGPDAERALVGIALAVAARERERHDIGQREIRLIQQHEPAAQPDRVAAAEEVSDRVPEARWGLRATKHRAGEAVDAHALIWRDLLPVSGYLAVPVDVPPVAVGVVRPEVLARPRRKIRVVGIDDPRHVREVRTSGLNREVDGNFLKRRKGERRTVQWYRSDRNLGERVSVLIDDSGYGRYVQL